MEKFIVESRGLSVELDVAKLSEDIKQRAMLHGLKQKIADAAAGAKKAAFRDKKDGETQEAYDAEYKAFDDQETIALAGQGLMQKVVDMLEQGDWGVERTSGAQVSSFDVECAELFIQGTKMEFAKGTKKPERIARALEELATRNTATQDKVRALVTKAREQAARDAELLKDLF